MKKILLSMAVACFGMTVSNAQSIILNQNFESAAIPSLPSGWTQATTGGGTGWVTNNTAVNWPLAGIPLHTGNFCLVNDYASFLNNPAKLTSPTFSLSGVANAYLAYDYYFIMAYKGSAQEKAWVEISTNGGSTYTVLDSILRTYNVTTPSASTWATKFVSLAAYSTASSCKLRFCYTDYATANGIIGVAIDNILVYGADTSDIGMASLSPIPGTNTDYVVSGSSITFSGVAANYGSTAISSFTANYQVGNGPVTSTTISTAISPYSTAAFSCPAYTSTGFGQKAVKVWVTIPADKYHKNDSLATSIVGVPFWPKKRVAFEEATGTWCGFCVRGIVYMDSLWRAHPDDVTIVSVHDSDPMSSLNSETMAYDTYISAEISGYPSMVIDRSTTDDPSGAFDDYNNLIGSFAYANIGITTTTSGSDVTAHIKVEPAVTMSGDYRLELIITEDGVDATHGGGGTSLGSAGWSQHDYYSSAFYPSGTTGVGATGAATYGPLTTIGYDFNTLPFAISAITFPFVARYTVPSSMVTNSGGVSGSLPSFLHVGTEYTYDFAPVTIPATWITSDLRYIVYLIDNNSNSPTYNHILNTTYTGTTPPYTFIPVSFVGVANVNGGIQAMTVFPNPAQDDAHVRFGLDQDANVHFAVYDMVGREVYSAPAEQMTAGNHQINFSTENYPAGLYNVIISTPSGKMNQQLSVVK